MEVAIARQMAQAEKAKRVAKQKYRDETIAREATRLAAMQAEAQSDLKA
jgi:hypothetical protein